MIKARIGRWRPTSLLRRVGELSSATALAQVIQLLNFVAIARLFPPSAVGEYSVYFAIVGTLAPVSLLCFDMLIPGTLDEDLPLYIKALLYLLVPVLATLLLFSELLAYNHTMAMCLWVAGVAVQRLAEMQNVRANRFFRISVGRLVPPLMMSILLAAFFYQEANDINRLIFWQSALMLLWGSVYLRLTFPRSFFAERHSWIRLAQTLRASSNAPLYLIPSNLLNLAAYNVPVLVIGHWFDPAMAAQYYYVLRFGFGPVGLIGGTLYQVFYGHLSEAVRTGDDAMLRQFARARRYVGQAALATAAVVAVLYPPAFRYVLGEAWVTAGWIAVVFAPLLALMLYLTPLSVSLNVFARQHYELKSQFYYFAISALSFGLAIMVESPWVGFVLFSVLGCARYGLLLRDINTVLDEHRVNRHEAVART